MKFLEFLPQISLIIEDSKDTLFASLDRMTAACRK
jgi:hypothetical protein